MFESTTSHACILDCWYGRIRQVGAAASITSSKHGVVWEAEVFDYIRLSCLSLEAICALAQEVNCEVYYLPDSSVSALGVLTCFCSLLHRRSAFDT